MAMDIRRELPKGIVIHTTEGGDRGTDADHVDRWVELATGERNVLTGFEVRQNGQIIGLVPPIHFMTWHTGSINNITVGIDLAFSVGSGNPRGSDGNRIPRAQLDALVELVNCCELVNLPILGHGTHWDPANRHDPGKDFPWSALGCDRIVGGCQLDCWDQKCVVTRGDILAHYERLRGRTSTYSWRDIGLDATAVFVGPENSDLT
jgi:hypothetical protein